MSDKYGFMPKKLMRCLYDEQGNFTKKVGDKLSVVIVDISEKGMLLSDVETYNKDLEKKRKKEAAERMKQLINNFASSYEIGSIFEAKVVKVWNSKVHIDIAGIEGIIHRGIGNPALERVGKHDCHTKGQHHTHQQPTLERLRNVFFVGAALLALIAAFFFRSKPKRM